MPAIALPPAKPTTNLRDELVTLNQTFQEARQREAERERNDRHERLLQEKHIEKVKVAKAVTKCLKQLPELLKAAANEGKTEFLVPLHLREFNAPGVESALKRLKSFCQRNGLDGEVAYVTTHHYEETRYSRSYEFSSYMTEVRVFFKPPSTNSPQWTEKNDIRERTSPSSWD